MMLSQILSTEARERRKFVFRIRFLMILETCFLNISSQMIILSALVFMCYIWVSQLVTP